MCGTLTELHLRRMDGRDLRVPHEVRDIQREDVIDTMCEHDRDKSRIVNLLAANAMGFGQLSPRKSDIVWLLQENK